MQHAENEVTLAFLASFADAWNRHDLDALMAHMHQDCVFMASVGTAVEGWSIVALSVDTLAKSLAVYGAPVGENAAP